jgi:hypothetical protein
MRRWNPLCFSLGFWVAALIFSTAACASHTPRDPWRQPFASDNIWNLPVATGAAYEQAHFQPALILPEVEYFVRTDGSIPMRPVYEPGSPYRATGTKLSWLKQMRVPDGFLVADITLRPYSTPNNCTSLVHFPSGNIVQLEPTTRVQPQGPIWGFPLIGENIYGQGEKGSHYGSGLVRRDGSSRRRLQNDSPGRSAEIAHRLRGDHQHRSGGKERARRSPRSPSAGTAAGVGQVNFFGGNRQTCCGQDHTCITVKAD